MKYFILVSGDLHDEFGNPIDAENCITDLVEDDLQADEITLIRGEEVEFRLLAKITEQASK